MLGPASKQREMLDQHVKGSTLFLKSSDRFREVLNASFFQHVQIDSVQNCTSYNAAHEAQYMRLFPQAPTLSTALLLCANIIDTHANIYGHGGWHDVADEVVRLHKLKNFLAMLALGPGSANCS